LLVVTFDWSFARLTSPVVTTTSLTFSSNKIQNGDILVQTNPGPPGKWPLGERVVFSTTFDFHVTSLFYTDYSRLDWSLSKSPKYETMALLI